ncbi:MAG: type II secretion system F family protein [Candidatus Aenigmatarchaeota archaeon]
MKIKFREMMLVSVILGMITIFISFRFFSENSGTFFALNLIGIALFIGMPVAYKYIQNQRIKKIEKLFPKFLRDITEDIKSGMTLPQAFKAASKNNYDALTPYVKEMSAKISFGITFEKVLKNFASKVGSKNMKRNIEMIIETHKSGGAVASVLEAVYGSLEELEKIKKERSATIYAQMINGYLIYIIFLGIIVALTKFLLPTFQMGVSTSPKSMFLEIFRMLIIIQGFFSGLAIGKLAEGTLVAGFKHAFILVTIGYSVFVLFA